ncbi:MAG: hypothetical protein KAG53_11840 [Endozoicomonadaceae bacterium]|nr:hypothetical protein [Endozoicomonadaceae bacterium]
MEACAHLISSRVDTDECPDCLDLKEEVGHGGDTVHGQYGYLVTLTERVSKLLLTARVKNKTKKASSKRCSDLIRVSVRPLRLITVESSQTTQALSCKNYFAKPYHSWQRRFNENTNGLLQ